MSTNLPSLYELAHEYRSLMERLTDAEFDDQTIADTVESVGILDDINAKAQNIEIVARSILQHDGAITEEIERLKALRTRRQHAAERLREYLKTEMEHMGIKRIECPLFTVAVQNNPQSVEVFDERMVPLDFMRQPDPPPMSPDKLKIAQALKAGSDVPGCKLKQTTRLSVK